MERDGYKLVNVLFKAIHLSFNIVLFMDNHFSFKIVFITLCIPFVQTSVVAVLSRSRLFIMAGGFIYFTFDGNNFNHKRGRVIILTLRIEPKVLFPSDGNFILPSQYN